MVSDMICPWCYVGKKRLEQAIENTQLIDKVALSYKPYLLYPDIPDHARGTESFPKKRSMGRLLHQAGEDVNISFDFKSISKIPDTLPLHYLMANLGDEKLAWKIKNRLFKAYFSEGADLSDKDIIEKIMSEFDISPNYKLNLDVHNSISECVELGITAVPSFIINEEHTISGAQEINRWEKYLLRLAK